MSRQYRELVQLLEDVGVMQDDSPWAIEVQELIKEHKRARCKHPHVIPRCPECGQPDCNGQCFGDDMMGDS